VTHHPLVSDTQLTRVPLREPRKPVIVLKFGGTMVGSTPDQGRIKLARELLAEYIERGCFVVPVFSAYRRGRSGSDEKISITDRLQSYADIILGEEDFDAGVEKFRRSLLDPHKGMLRDLGLDGDLKLVDELRDEIDHLTETAELCCRAHEQIESLDSYLVTGGERLSTRILSAYFNRLHAEGKFPWATARVTALEMGLYTDDNFMNANIEWERAVEHARDVLIGKYLEKGIMPVVTGFAGIYDPNKEFPDILREDRLQQPNRRYTGVYRTGLGRGGSDLTATFLGLALGAEYVGFAKETPGVLTGDDMLVGDSARTIPELDYDLATEAGNIYPKAVEPVRAGSVPVHIFDPARPQEFTAISDANLSDGLFLITRPEAAVNIHVNALPDTPGALIDLLRFFANYGADVAEVRHHKSGTDVIVTASEEKSERVVVALDEANYQPQPTYIWYVRVIGNITPELSMRFNEFVNQFHPQSTAAYQTGTKVLTATFHRNRAGTEESETARIQGIVKRIHDELVVPSLGGRTEPPAPADPSPMTTESEVQ